MLWFLYATGVRVSELCQLKWRDLQSAGTRGGQVTVFGKADKTCVVAFSCETWEQVLSLRGDAGVPLHLIQATLGHESLTTTRAPVQ